ASADQRPGPGCPAARRRGVRRRARVCGRPRPRDPHAKRLTMKLPHVTPGRWPQLRPDRFAATIRTDSPDGCRVALLGLPDDTGVALLGGRPGAAEGPAAFRAA